MTSSTRYMALLLLLTSCQRELHFPSVTVVSTPPEKLVTAVVVTNPSQSDYDSIVFRYQSADIREVHFGPYGDSSARHYLYDAAGRLSGVEDDKAIYYTNNNRAIRIRFQYNAAGQLQQTSTDFDGVSNVTAHFSESASGSNRLLQIIDTSYKSASYNLDWNNRYIYYSISADNRLLADSAIYINTTNPGLVKTTVNRYTYESSGSVTADERRVYFNGQLSEYGTLYASSDLAAPEYISLRKKLFRNLSGWFDAGAAWQDDNYHLFPLPGGPYRSILYSGYTQSAGANAPPYTRSYLFDNTYVGNRLIKSVIAYTLQGQGASQYSTILRFYYNN